MSNHKPGGVDKGTLWRRFMPFLPLVGAVAVCIVILLPFSRQPVQAFMDICLYPLASRAGLSATLIRVTPIAACALGTIVAWKSGLYHLGFDGCYLAGRWPQHSWRCSAPCQHGPSCRFHCWRPLRWPDCGRCRWAGCERALAGARC
ncbi:hypothetical protein RAA17_15070 [Komagataeibacter rhaeticus]|nr:hypothetical protein [Komagataeibacter rhaeticus]